MKLMMLLAIAILQLTLTAPANASEAGLMTAADPAVVASEPVVLLAQAAPADDGKMMDVTVNMNTPSHSRMWYSQPIWIAVFVLGGIVVLTLLVMALRGSNSGSTVVKT